MRFFILFLLTAATAAAQNDVPSIGYIYPAGGRQGTKVNVIVGGKQIARATDVIVGSGVKAEIVKRYAPMFLQSSELQEPARKIYAEARGIIESPDTEKNEERLKTIQTLFDAEYAKGKLERIPYWDELLHPTEDALQLIYYEYFSQRPDKQPKETLAQGVLLKLTIDKHAFRGLRELRLVTSQGITKPARFIVGAEPEVLEWEPNDFNAPPQQQFTKMGGNTFRLIPKTLRSLEPQTLPVVFNGRIRRGDVDMFPFAAKKGQQLDFTVNARTLIPYLADAVPGWFQPAITLFAPDGEQLAASDSFGFDPDPVLTYKIQRDGIYRIAVNDSIFRGRDDFVYRLSVTESIDKADIFPLRGKTAWGTLKSVTEEEVWEQKTVTLPLIIDGRIESEDETDEYRFDGKEGDTVVVDVAALALNSPVDTAVELLDDTGKIIAENDDRAGSDVLGRNIGLETHHADPYLLKKLPKSGTYTVRIYSQFHDDKRQPAYRLRLSKPRQDFTLFVSPSAVNFSGQTASVTFHLIRLDGFSGEVKIALPQKLSEQFKIENAVIAADKNQATVKLTLLKPLPNEPVKLEFEGTGTCSGRKRVQSATGVDDWEQAFIYHHLVPVESVFALQTKNNRQRKTKPK
ncbi:MAG: PPC domain-containing protein [Planctomycetaceae bacterium]|jgi:hypothetical protein|nr:PPC domain-containing protein [Planctomycetaceae bacterium]